MGQCLNITYPSSYCGWCEGVHIYLAFVGPRLCLCVFVCFARVGTSRGLGLGPSHFCRCRGIHPSSARVKVNSFIITARSMAQFNAQPKRWVSMTQLVSWVGSVGGAHA